MYRHWPRIETPTHWVMTGFDEDLNKAMVNAVRETVAASPQRRPERRSSSGEAGRPASPP